MTRSSRWIVSAVGALVWVALTYGYAHWAAVTAHNYWAAPPGTSHSLVVLLLATLPTSIAGFIPMYLYAADAWNGGTLAVSHDMAAWFAVLAVINSVVVVALVFGVVRAVKHGRRRALHAPTGDDLMANPYLT